MAKRVISEAINIRINVGNYQHIEITKQAQEEIEYSSESERLEREAELSKDIIDSVISSMKLVPERLGKGVENAQEVEDSISKAIPEWLEKSPPNLANVPKKNSDKVAAEQKSNKDDNAKSLDNLIGDVPEVVSVVESSTEVVEDLFDGDDLFDDDESPATPEVSQEVVKEEVKEEQQKTAVTVSDDFDLFDDDEMDLFGE
jgi:hypothetical protein